MLVYKQFLLYMGGSIVMGVPLLSLDVSWKIHLPSGKLTVCYGKSQSLIGKSTINGPCSIAMLNYQRVPPF